MKSFNGWAGTILNVNLATDRVEKEPLSLAFARKYLGASGFNAVKLFELVRPEVDALSPENVLMFATGPFVGTLFPGCVRTTVTAKSPLTDVLGHAGFAGAFGPELKFAGYDQVVISGKAEHPVYLWIDDDEVELRDASNLWGKSTWEAASLIREELGDPDVKVACIGQAGENLVRFASVIVPQARAAGRSGMGAVMGSKNLKAIAVRGSKDISIARPGEFLQICREAREYIPEKHPHYAVHHEFGAPGYMNALAPAGIIGDRNFQRTVIPIKDLEPQNHAGHL